MRSNENVAIGLFKEEMIKILLEINSSKREKLLKELQTEIEKYVLPLRELKSSERKKNISNKYKTIKRIVFKMPILSNLGGSMGIFRKSNN